MRANLRVPDQTIGDFYAQIAANGIGMARVQELCERYGAENDRRRQGRVARLFGARMRAAIEACPTAYTRARQSSTTTAMATRPAGCGPP